MQGKGRGRGERGVGGVATAGVAANPRAKSCVCHISSGSLRCLSSLKERFSFRESCVGYSQVFIGFYKYP